MQGDIVLAGFPLFVLLCNICQQPISDKGLYIRKAKIKNRSQHIRRTHLKAGKVSPVIGPFHQILPLMQVFKNSWITF